MAEAGGKLARAAVEEATAGRSAAEAAAAAARAAAEARAAEAAARAAEAAAMREAAAVREAAATVGFRWQRPASPRGGAEGARGWAAESWAAESTPPASPPARESRRPLDDEEEAVRREAPLPLELAPAHSPVGTVHQSSHPLQGDALRENGARGGEAGGEGEAARGEALQLQAALAARDRRIVELEEMVHLLQQNLWVQRRLEANEGEVRLAAAVVDEAG